MLLLYASLFAVLSANTEDCPGWCGNPLDELTIWTDNPNVWRCELPSVVFTSCSNYASVNCLRLDDLGGDLYLMVFPDSPDRIGIDPDFLAKGRVSMLDTKIQCKNGSWTLPKENIRMTHVLCDQYIIDKQKALASPNKPLPPDQDTTIPPQPTVEVTTETTSVAPPAVTETEPTKAATSGDIQSTSESSPTTVLVESTNALSTGTTTGVEDDVTVISLTPTTASHTLTTSEAATVTVMLKIFTSTAAAPMEIAIVPPPITTTPISITSATTTTVALTSKVPDLSDPSGITTQSTETAASSKVEATTSSTEASDLPKWTSDEYSYVGSEARSTGTSPATASLKPTENQIREKPLTHKIKSVVVSGVASSGPPPTGRSMPLPRNLQAAQKTPKVIIHVTKKSDIPSGSDPYDSAPMQVVKKRPRMKWSRRLPKTSTRTVYRLTQANPKTVKLTSSRTSEKVSAVRARPLTKVGKAPRSAQQKRYRSIAPSRAHVKVRHGIQATSPVRRRGWKGKGHRTKLTASISKKAN